MHTEATAFTCLGLGIFLLLIGVQKFKRGKAIQKNGAKTIGKIIDLIEDYTSEGKQFFPVIEYNTLSGTITKKSKVSRVNPKVNQEIEIIYLIDKPEEFIENDFYSETNIGIIGIANGVLLLITSAILFFNSNPFLAL